MLPEMQPVWEMISEHFGTTWAALATFLSPFEPQLGQNAPRGCQNDPKRRLEQQSGTKRNPKGAKSGLKAAESEPKITQRKP